MRSQEDEFIVDVFGTPKECLRVEAHPVTKKKETTSGLWKKVVGCFKPKQQEREEFDKYNLATLFRIEKVLP